MAGRRDGCVTRSERDGKGALVQLGVFSFGLLEDGDVGVGVFSKGDEVLARQSIGIETASSLEWDAIKVPVGGFFAESVA
jgi:hypothetical protein